jgi:hypothetical protein
MEEGQTMSNFKRMCGKLLIGVLLLAIAAVALLRHSCPSASERADAITTEDIENMGKGLKRAQALQALVTQLAATRPGSAQREAKLEEMVASFDPATQAYLRAVPRIDRIDAIRLELEKDMAATERKFKANEQHFWCR